MADVRRCPAPRHKGPNPLPLAFFSTDPRKSSGRASWCRECMNEAARDRRAANPEPRRAAWRRAGAALEALRPRWPRQW